jgi:hypothetical protein
MSSKVVDMLQHPRPFPEPQARELMVEGRMMRLQFSLLQFKNLEMGQLSLSYTDGSPVPDETARLVRDAFFSAEDDVTEFKPEDRRAAHAALGQRSDIVRNTRQYLGRNPKPGEEWRG